MLLSKKQLKPCNLAVKFLCAMRMMVYVKCKMLLKFGGFWVFGSMYSLLLRHGKKLDQESQFEMKKMIFKKNWKDLA